VLKRDGTGDPAYLLAKLLVVAGRIGDAVEDEKNKDQPEDKSDNDDPKKSFSRGTPLRVAQWGTGVRAFDQCCRHEWWSSFL
jgi:hypothetical protein